MFIEFDNYLKSDFSEDYWSDEGIGFAEEKIHEFASDDWLAINEKWKNRNTVWLVRCANTLGEVNNSKSFKLLASFILVDDVEVKISALDSINSLLSMGAYDKDINLLLVQKIEEIKSSSSIVNTMLNSLRGKLEMM